MSLIEHLEKVKLNLEYLNRYLDSPTTAYAAHRSHFYNEAYQHILRAIECLKHIKEQLGIKETK
jgi:intein-encoded DNA endonuclease-like protein